MTVGDQVGPGELPDGLEQSTPVQPRERGDPRLAVEAHAVTIGHGYEEQVEHPRLRRETAQVTAPDQPSIDPGEAETAGLGKSSNPIGADRGVPEAAPSRRALSRAAHCQISRPQA